MILYQLLIRMCAIVIFETSKQPEKTYEPMSSCYFLFPNYPLYLHKTIPPKDAKPLQINYHTVHRSQFDYWQSRAIDISRSHHHPPPSHLRQHHFPLRIYLRKPKNNHPSTNQMENRRHLYPAQPCGDDDCLHRHLHQHAFTLRQHYLRRTQRPYPIIHLCHRPSLTIMDSSCDCQFLLFEFY